MKLPTLRPALLLGLALVAVACSTAGTATPTAPAPAPTPAEIATQPEPPVPPTDAPIPAPAWEAAIVQNGAVLTLANDSVTLARAPFTLRLTMPVPEAVKLNVFTTDQNFQTLQPGFVFTPDCEVALCTGMDVAEDRLNLLQTLFVDVQLTHYIYYLAPDDHRWSRADVSATAATFERDVAFLNATPIDQTTDPALFLLLLINPANPQQIDPGELKKITLSFAPAS